MVAQADFLPGHFVIEAGTLNDYRALAHLHYAPGDPATRAGVWRARYLAFTEHGEDRPRVGDPPSAATAPSAGAGSGSAASTLSPGAGSGSAASALSPGAGASCQWPLFLGDPQLNGGCPRPLRVSFSIGGSEHPLKRPRRGSRRAPAPPPAPGQLVAVAVLSYPTPQLRARERALALVGPRYGAKLAFVNAHVRTISRVIVHPQFRSLGLASALVRCVLLNCPVRYVEAVATMGDVHPFFERAGMTRIPPAGQGEAAYFLFDRLSCSDDSKDAEDARGTTETSGATRATGVTSTTGAMGSIAATGKGGVR